MSETMITEKPTLGWLRTDPARAYFAAERAVSPRLEAALRTEAAMDAITVAVAVRRIAGRALANATNGAVEALGLPSSRQVRRLQRSVDDLQRSTG